MISANVETITPEAASAALMNNTVNRPLSRNVVRSYAAAMKRGEWRLNGEPIIFFEDGLLANGQHRLNAIIAANQPVEVLVVRGTSRETFTTIDGGAKRSIGNILAMKGAVNERSLAAAIRAYLRIAEGSSTARTQITATQALKTLEEVPSLAYWTTQYISAKTARGLFTSSIVAVLTLAALRHGDEVVHKFLDEINTGAGLAQNSPTLRLREKFMTRGVGKHFNQDSALALYIKAMNAHIKKQPVTFLRQGSEDMFPALV